MGDMADDAIDRGIDEWLERGGYPFGGFGATARQRQQYAIEKQKEKDLRDFKREPVRIETTSKEKTAMATKKSDVKPVMTPVFRVSFPAVFTPKSIPGSKSEPKYSITMLFKKTDDISDLKKNVAEVLTEQFGADKTKWPKFGSGPGLVRLPFRDGAEKDYQGYGPDMLFISASNKNKPGLVDSEVQPIIEPNEFYGGCYARCKVRAFWYDNAGNRGVSFSLGNIQKVKDGEPFSGATKPEDDFDAIKAPAAKGGAAPAAGAEDNPLGL